MTAVIALGAALGLLMIYSGIRAVDAPRPRGPITLFEKLGPRPERILAASVGLAIIAFIFVAGATGSAVIGAAFASLAGTYPVRLRRNRSEKARRRNLEEWPDAIATLLASIRAGVSLPEACVHLATRVGEPLRPHLEAFVRVYRSSGSFTAALRALRTSADDPVADRVVVCLEMAHEVGGSDLVRVLRTLGDMVRADLHVRREVEARWSWTVTSAKVAAAAPWIVLLIMGLRPEAAAAYGSPRGIATIAIGGALTVVGYKLMLRAGRLPEEGRLRI